MTLHYLVRGVWAESLKLRRSLALLSAVLMPLLLAFVNFMGTLQTGVGKPVQAGDSRWSTFFMYSIKLWVIFAMPLVVAILSALLADVEHRPKAWKQLLALRFPRSAIFASKWLALLGITLLSTLAFGATNLAGGILIQLFRPDLGLERPIPILEAFSKPLVAWLLSMFMVSIHMWISLRWPSFLVSITCGFAAAIANLFVISSPLYVWSPYFPWAMPVQAYDRWQSTLIPCLVGAGLVYLLAQRQFVRRDVY